MNIVKSKKSVPARVLLYGCEGIGKTILAAKFPNAVFIDLEGGTNRLDVARVEPPPTSHAALLATIRQLENNPDYSTIVIDTIDKAQELFVAKVCAEANVGYLDERPYGALYSNVCRDWAAFLDILTAVAVKKNIVLVAHSKLRRVNMPNEVGEFDKYELNLITSPRSDTAALSKQWADDVIFINYQIRVVENEKGIGKAQGGKRMAYTSHTPYWDAKSRSGLPASFEMPGVDAPLTVLAPLFAPQTAGVATPIPATIATEPTTPPPPSPVRAASPRKELLDRIKELCATEGISLDDVEKCVIANGVMPKDTKLVDWPEGIFTRVINGWDKITGQIKQR